MAQSGFHRLVRSGLCGRRLQRSWAEWRLTSSFPIRDGYWRMSKDQERLASTMRRLSRRNI
eukprot:8565760-Prorocentrum_lima.AAC.1